MNYFFLLFKVILLFNYFIGVYTKNIKNANFVVAILRDENDDNYDEANEIIQNKIDELVNDRMNDIYEVIEENQDSYGEQDEKIKEINSIPPEKRWNKDKKFLFINKRKRNKKNSTKFSSDFSNSSKNSTIEYIPFESVLVNHICPISNYYAISVYLSKKTAKIVCQMKNVLYCEESTESKFIDLPISKPKPKPKSKKKNNIKRNNSNIYYDIDAIKKETGWSDVSVQQISYTPNHLSFLSQSPFLNPDKSQDTNFYYPSTAGKGIDIYLIDQGLNTNHEDFNKYKGTPDERTITCDAIIKEHSIHITNDKEKNNCSGVDYFPQHGVMSASMAGGSIYGVAKKANIHMIAFDCINLISALRGFDFILQNGKPHKTVISLSLGNEFSSYKKAEEDKLADLIKQGFIIVASAGNEKSNCCSDKSSKNFFRYSGYRKAIIVGATDSSLNGMGYNVAGYSNYGNCVDIYGPGDVTFPYPFENSKTDITDTTGTSCSTPLIAGIAASIMSEHPEIKYDNELMRKTLIEMSIKNSIDFQNFKADDTPNRFVNNGKKRIYYPNDSNNKCGTSNNGNKCSDGCCTKDGECISFENHPGDQCFIENGCQSEFGYCTTKEKSIEDCEKELKENEKCFIENFSNNKKEDIINQCKNIIYSQKCQIFYRNQLTDQSICSIAKQYKKIKFFDNFNLNVYNSYIKSCDANEIYLEDKEIIKKKCDKDKKFCETECEFHLDNYNKCMIDDLFDDYSDNDLKEYDYFIDKCAQIKYNTCQNFFSNAEKEIISNPYCSYLYENGIKKNILDVYDDKYLVNFTLKNYNKLNKKCERVLNKISEKKCDQELQDYKGCIHDVSKQAQLSVNEIAKKCYTYYDPLCQSLYIGYNTNFENYEISLPYCHYTNQLQSTNLLNKVKETVNTYKDFCSGKNNENLRKIYINDCNNLMKNDKYVFDYHSEMTNDELNKKCKKFNSYGIDVLDEPICVLAGNYIDDNVYSNYLAKYTLNESICGVISEIEDDNEFINENCEYELKENNFCLLNGEPTDDKNDLNYRCLAFEECQKFYDNPVEFIPSCIMIKRYKKNAKINIPEILDKSSKKYKFYKEKCLPNSGNTSTTTTTTKKTTTTTTTKKTAITTTTKKTTTTTKKTTTTTKKTTTTTKKTTTSSKRTTATTKKTTTTTKKTTTSTKKSTKKTTTSTKKSTKKTTTSTKKTTKKTTSTKKSTKKATTKK